MVKYGTLFTFRLALLTLDIVSRFGRDSFQEAIKIAQRVDTDMLKWNQFNYVVFDIPNHQDTYEDSYNLLGTNHIFVVKVNNLISVERVNKHIQTKGTSFLRVAEKAVCTGLPHLEAFYQDIVNKGGEGIILRDPKSPYRPGRSPGYLKHKVFDPITSIHSELILCSRNSGMQRQRL